MAAAKSAKAGGALTPDEDGALVQDARRQDTAGYDGAPVASPDGAAHPSSADIIALYEATAAAFDRERRRGTMEAAWLERFMAVAVAASDDERLEVLDLGCGMAEPIAAWLTANGAAVTGVDAAPAMIDLCRQRFPAGDWIVADMRGLDLGRRYSGILAWNSFFHLTAADQRAMFPVFRAHARPSAALMFTSGPARGEAIGRFQGRPLYHASLDPDEYRRALAAAGFEVVGHVSRDPGCGGLTVWLARAEPRN